MNARKWLGGLLVVGIAWTAVAAAAELAPENKDKLVAIDTKLQKVIQLYREKKIDEMNKLIGEVESTLGSLQAEGSLGEPVLAPFKARLAGAQKLSAHALITATATSTPPTAKPAGTRPGRPAAPMPGAMGVDFARDVAPIFVAKCGNCHVRGNRGDFNMGTFAALMAGTQGQFTVIKPGKGDTSTIVEKMASGEMPPGGNKVTQQELEVIIKWIDEGAKFAGDPQASLMALVPGAAGGRPGMPVIARAGAGDKVQFMRDVAPILIENCFNCHGSAQGNNNSGNFGMFSFAQLMRGGQDGPVIAAGNPDGSVFVQMLRGTAKGLNGETRPRMPRNGQLDEAEMNAIVQWIRDGAKFDGEDPAMSIDLAWRIAMAKKATHDELKAQRLATGQKNWRTANPDSPGETIEADDFLFIGNLGPSRMQEVVKLAEAEKAKIIQSMKIPTDKPLLKGRLTIFVFDKGFEHKEFGRVIENRELPAGSSSHWFFNYIDAYACVVAPPDKTESMAPLLAETIFGAYLDSCGSEMPRWFAVGTARNIAVKMHPNNPYGKMWEDALPQAFSSGIKPDGIMTTRNPDAGTAALAQAFVKDLMRSPSWNGLLNNLRNGVRFDGAFNQAYRTAPLPLLTAWMRRGG